MIPRFIGISTERIAKGLLIVEQLLEEHRLQHPDHPECPMESATRLEIARIKLELLRRQAIDPLPQYTALNLTIDEFGELNCLAVLGGAVMSYHFRETPLLGEMIQTLVKLYAENSDMDNVRQCEELVNRLTRQQLTLLERTAEEFDANR